MKQDNSVICPNCGVVHEIDSSTKSCGWDTLDGMMAITTGTFSLLVGLGVVVALKCAEWCGAFTPSVELILTAFIVSVTIAFPAVAQLMVRYQKKTLEGLGLSLYRIQCSCRPENTFTIIRPIITKREDTLNQNEAEHNE